MHNYYRYATYVNEDFCKIAFLVSKNLYNSTNRIRGRTGSKSKAHMEYYGKYNFKTTYVASIAMFPIAGIRTKNVMNFSQSTCNYTKEGRKIIHEKLKGINFNILRYIMGNPIESETSEYNDNRISLYVGQMGRCSITGEQLQMNDMESHHKIPRKLGGKDEYKNLTFIISDIHKLIHAVTEEIKQKYINKVKKYINKENLKKINKLRKLVGNCELYIS